MNIKGNNYYSIQQLLDDKKEALGLSVLAGDKGLKRQIDTIEVQRPSLALAGFVDGFVAKRIQVLGANEIRYLDSLSTERVSEIARLLFSLPIPCVIVSKSLIPSEPFLKAADENDVPVLSSKRTTSEVLNQMWKYLSFCCAPRVSIHATMVDVYGVGMLYRGKSGVGKSECALDLIARGHRLVADDVVMIQRRSDNILIAAPKANAGHIMEIRGVGIIDVERIYGVGAVRLQKRVELVVNLTRWEELKDNYERLGVEQHYTEILGVRVPEVTIPVTAGKNLASVSEVIALNLMLRIYGENPAERFIGRLSEQLKRKSSTREYLQEDFE